MVNCSIVCSARVFLNFAASLLILFGVTPSFASLGFYYGTRLDVYEWQQFNQLVVQPAHVSESHLKELKSLGVRPIAYISLGEVAISNPVQKTLPKSWFIGDNPDWQSKLLDLRRADVRQWFLEHRLEPLVQRGFEGIFLDTLDSFHRLPKHTHGEFQEVIPALIRQMKLRMGNQSALWVNRGFDMLDALASTVDGIVFESLYRGYRNDTQSYFPVDENSRLWLMEQSKRALQLGLSVVAIDYLPDQNADQALQWARQISAYGIQPYITDGHLTRIGSAAEIPVSRKILAIHEGNPKQVDLNKVHTYATTPLEYLGYQVDYLSARGELPDESMVHRYAGIVVWPESGLLVKHWCSWLEKQSDSGIRVVFLGILPDHSDCHAVAGIENDRALVRESIEVLSKKRSVGAFEAPLVLRKTGLRITRLKQDDGAWLTLKVGHNVTHPIAITNSGGYAVSPYVISSPGGKIDRWLFDPVEFFKSALKLPDIPVIDVSTETGRRMLLAHIDGDGFVSKAEFDHNPLAAEVILDRIIRRYRIPHTVSVIEAEVSKQGVYPKYSYQAEKLARKIFIEPNVELASHTFSHPFFWRVLEGEAPAKVKRYGTHLPVENYQLNLKREVEGSIRYINEILAPENKRVKVFLWSGDARPGDEALRQVNKSGVWNVNGGNTRVLPFQNSLTQVWPVGFVRRNGVQIYAPIMNENVYTNEWTGPYYGYRQVVQTFQLLESPRRLKPINVYYHFYSGTKPEALQALEEVYRWVTTQSVQPMYLSEYAARATAFYRARMTRDDKNIWRLYSPLPVRTLRTSADERLLRGTAIAGSHEHQGQRYYHVAPSSTLAWRVDNEPKKSPALDSGTIILDNWQWEKQETNLAAATFSYHSWSKPELWIRAANNCKVSLNNEKLSFYGKGRIHITLPWSAAEGVGIVCTR